MLNKCERCSGTGEYKGLGMMMAKCQCVITPAPQKNFVENDGIVVENTRKKPGRPARLRLDNNNSISINSTNLPNFDNNLPKI